MSRAWAIAAALLLAGCGAPSQASDAGEPSDSGVVSCEDDARVTPYAPGLTVADSAGDRQYVLQSGTPAPPLTGTNAWTVKILGADGGPLEDLRLDAAAFMPDHGHGSSVIPQVTSNGDGTYGVAPLYFFMPGVWRVTLTDADGGSPAEAGVFWLCVEG